MGKTIRNIFLIICAAIIIVSFAAVSAHSENELTIYVESPSGASATVTLPETATAGELKTAISSTEAFKGIVFSDDAYRLYCGDASLSDRLFEDETKTLIDCGLESGDTVHVEKYIWDATDEPLQLFGLTITGGRGGLEHYGGGYDAVDYYWSYHFKYITIKTDTPVTISGTGEQNANILINHDDSHVTFDNLTLTCDDSSCVTVNPDYGLNLTIKGSNALHTSKEPAIVINQGGGWLRISAHNSSDTLHAVTTENHMAAIGIESTSTVFFNTPISVDIDGGIVVANGGANAPAVLAHSIGVSGGTLIANGGSGSSCGIYAYDCEEKAPNLAITGGAVKTSAIETNDPTPVTENTVIFENGNGRVIGNAGLNADLTVESGETLTIPGTDETDLFIEPGVTLYNAAGGIIDNKKGTLSNNGTIYNEGTINTICVDETEYINENEGIVNYRHIGFDHEIADVVYLKKGATCKEKAVYYKSCICGTSTKGIDEDAVFTAGDLAEHQWDDGVVTRKPTLFRDGVMTYTCDICHVTKEESIPKLTVDKEETEEPATPETPDAEDDNKTTEVIVKPSTSNAEADRSEDRRADRSEDRRADRSEYKSENPDTPTAPDTGDQKSIAVWISLVLACGYLLVSLRKFSLGE